MSQHHQQRHQQREYVDNSKPAAVAIPPGCMRDPDVADFYNLRIEIKKGEPLWRLRENVLTARGPEERVCEWLPFEDFSPHLLTARGAFQGFVFDRLGWQPMERKAP